MQVSAELRWFWVQLAPTDFKSWFLFRGTRAQLPRLDRARAMIAHTLARDPSLTPVTEGEYKPAKLMPDLVLSRAAPGATPLQPTARPVRDAASVAR